jgi:hypothetical protein
MHGADMGIVQVTGMGVGAVHERSPRGVDAIAGEEKTARTGAAELQREPSRGAAPRQRRADGDDPQVIEHQSLHSLDDGVRRVLQPETRGPFGENGSSAARCLRIHG